MLIAPVHVFHIHGMVLAGRFAMKLLRGLGMYIWFDCLVTLNGCISRL